MNIHYTMHKVADLLGISADAIRLYERENHTVKSNMTALHDHTKDMQKIDRYHPADLLTHESTRAKCHDRGSPCRGSRKRLCRCRGGDPYAFRTDQRLYGKY